jgi:hypothetical protein
MTADTNNLVLMPRMPMYTECSTTEPAVPTRTPAEKARILARLTLALAAVDKQEGRAHGDA